MSSQDFDTSSAVRFNVMGLTTLLKAQTRSQALAEMNVWQNNPAICLKTMLAAARFIKVRDPTLVDVILERLIHSTYKIELKGGSMRKKKSLLTKSEA